MYLVFAGDNYYPQGGWDDLIHSTEDLEEAREVLRKAKEPSYTWGYIVDLERFLLEKEKNEAPA